MDAKRSSWRRTKVCSRDCHADIPVDPGEAGLELGVTARLQSAESSREDRT